MRMKKYKNLIENLPYAEQAFIPNEKVWKEILELNNYNSIDFDFENGYSRKELFDMVLSIKKLICILMWGYPTGGRGNHIKKLVGKLSDVEKSLEEYNGKEVGISELIDIITKFESLESLGRSTWSKFLYFSNISYEKGRLLILDDRIVKALNRKTFDEIEFHNMKNYQTTKPRRKAEIYIEYLDKMNCLAEKNNLLIDQLELFFFMFSNVLRL